MNDGNIKNRNIFLILAIVLILGLAGGGTMAWLSWNSANNTLVSITVSGGTLTIDGGGNINGFNMAPTDQRNHENYAIKRTINASANNSTVTDMMAYIQLYTNSTLFPSVYKMENLGWAISSSDSDCSTSSNILASGNFSQIDNSSDTSKKENTPLDLISFSVPAGQTVSKTYYLYIWVNEDYTVTNVGNTVTASIQDKSFTVELTGMLDNTPILSPSEFLNGATPVLESGMVPITLSADGVATSADTSSEWYDYQNKEWANAVLVDSSVRGTYINADGTINDGLTIPEANILAYYVWIPRYKYAFPNANGSPETISIVFENKDTPKSTGTATGTSYYTHPAFTFGTNNELNGIWVGKFETSGDATTPKIKPNVQSLRIQDVSIQFITSLKFAGGTMDTSTGEVTFAGNSVYGLTANTDSHMMKNSEWGAVAYLSHSQYGINQEIYINNSSGFYTGRSGGNVGGSVNTLATQFPDSQTSTNKYNTYGYYTWTGQSINPSGTIEGYASDRTLGTKASTTGNVTGVYDMSGGAYEYVMGNYNSTSASCGFTTFPSSKYYDMYSITSNTSCTLATCGGHALSETRSWYNDNVAFVASYVPWFFRGGYSRSGADAGAFGSNGFVGYADGYYSWRSVLAAEDGA